MLIKEQTIEQFNPSDVFELQDEFNALKWTIKALGVLIQNCDMDDFKGSHQGDSDELRWGLRQLIDFCVDHHEEQLDKLGQKVRNSAELIIEDAMKLSSGSDKERIQKSLFKVKQVLSQFGQEEYPKAVVAQSRLLALLVE